MASAMYAMYEKNHRMHGSSSKRVQDFSEEHSFGNGFHSYNMETVGESDTRSQKTAEVCQGRPYFSSETASEDSCSMRRNLIGITCHTSAGAHHSAASSLGSKASLSTRAGRNHFRKHVKDELDKVQTMISIVEAREVNLRSVLQMPELETNVSSSKSACEPSLDRWESFEDTDFAPSEERMRISGKPRTKGGVKRALHLNAALQIPKRQRFDSDVKRVADLMRQCGTILKKLRTHKYSWVFNQPVDFVALQIPDYPMLIKHPMDLGTIKLRMEAHAYHSPLMFAEDVRLTFANAMKFNPRGHDVHFMADFLLKIFEERWKNVERKLKQLHFDNDSRMRVYDEPVETVVQSSRPRVSTNASMAASRGQSKPNAELGMTKMMTYEEKQVLSEMLEDVPMEKLDQVMAIIMRKDPDVKPVDGEVTIEIDRLDPDALWELYSLLKHPKIASKAICQDSKPHGGESAKLFPGGGNLPQTTVGEGATSEEDVDIGGDVPMIHYAQVHIDKDAAICSSLSSSSSGNSSSSSDSDSGDSSESDSDGEDAQSHGSDLKLCSRKEPVGSVGSGAVYEARGSPTPKMDDAKRPLSDLDEEVSLTRPSALNEEPGQRGKPGEACVQEPQPQEKLHRAAMLKNRFADTILKAREKTLPSSKSNASDPDMVRKEKEELERLQREEKARIQAEAKAVESARKKVEAAALEKARREREAQRLAARLVIQQMEKTVEMDETDDFMKDLQMLGSVPADRLSNVCEFSPSHSQEGSTILPFNCTNPLQQLGLFMKEDDEEDEQETIRSLQTETISPLNQNEEGEVDD